MTIKEILKYNTPYLGSIVQVYFDWTFVEPGTEDEELLSRMLAHMADVYFQDVEEKKTFLLSLER